MIALIDYRAGNLTSVKKALATVGADVFVPESPADLADADAIIVPGVGHFGATRALAAPWVDAIRERVDAGRPLLGICLGMQWLFDSSEEAPDLQGLGMLSGQCYRLGSVPLKPDTTSKVRPDATSTPVRSVRLQADHAIKIPHVGWNSLSIRGRASILDGVADEAQVYFTHSYVAPITGDTAAVTEHGERFAAVVQREHVAGVQFHPEKSGDVGLQILRNFLRLAA